LRPGQLATLSFAHHTSISRPARRHGPAQALGYFLPVCPAIGLTTPLTTLMLPYEIMGCYRVEWHPIVSFGPRHVLILEEDGMHRTPRPPTFAFNDIPVVGRAVVTALGRGRLSSSAATVPPEKDKALVNFDVPPKEYRRPTIKTYAKAEEMFAARPPVEARGGSDDPSPYPWRTARRADPQGARHGRNED
jgi:hypothetical protein